MSLIAGRGCRWPPSSGQRVPVRTVVGGGVTRMMAMKTARSSCSSATCYVRGGTPDQNRIEYDGFRVYEVDHLFGYFSAFNMDAIEDVELSKGGFEARHGGALSSVMQITGKSGRLDRTAGGVGASLLSFNGTVETPLFNNKGSALLAVRRSFQGPLYNSILNLFDNNPAGGPGQAVGQRGGRGGRFATFDTQPSSNFYDINGKVVLNPSSDDAMSGQSLPGKRQS